MFGDFIVWAVILSLGGLVLIALAGRFLDWAFSRRYEKMKVECRLCGMRFYARDRGRFAECPHCGAVNKR